MSDRSAIETLRLASQPFSSAISVVFNRKVCPCAAVPPISVQRINAPTGKDCITQGTSDHSLNRIGFCQELRAGIIKRRYMRPRPEHLHIDVQISRRFVRSALVLFHPDNCKATILQHIVDARA